jgi:tyrosyl-tRNA synthetase
MLGGADLIRRKEGEDAFALTCKLIMTHDGKKMGKTEKGALWLDAERTSPYEFYQYWRNVADQDVERFLGLLTFPGNMLLGLGILLSANEVPRIAQQFGLDSSVRVNMMSVVHATTTAVNLTRSLARSR